MLCEDVKRNIRIYSRYGYSYAEIAERTGAAFSEIRKVIEEEKAMRKISPEKREEIMKCLENGMKWTEITERCGVSRSTVQRTADEWKSKKSEPETAATVTDSEKDVLTNTSSENIIPNDSENVKPIDENSENGFCCNRTSCTDMEAHKTERRKISATKYIPDAVEQACIEKRADLLGELEDIKEQILEIEKFLGINEEVQE